MSANQSHTQNTGYKTDDRGESKGKRPKDIPAQLRFDCPPEQVTDEWLECMAIKFERSYADFILYYLSNDFYHFLVSDWRDATAILRSFINEVHPFVDGKTICTIVDQIVRGYEEATTCYALPIPDPIRLGIFVNEVVETALSIEGYKSKLTAELRLSLHNQLRSAVMDRILPRPAQLVLQRSGIFQPDLRKLRKKAPHALSSFVGESLYN